MGDTDPADPAGDEAEHAISIPEFGSFAELDEISRLTLEVEAQAEVERFGPTSEAAHPPVAHPALDRLRSLCLMLPETTEVTPFGHPTFRVAARAYATFELVDGAASILFKSDPERQSVLVTGDAFARDPDTGHHGWTVVTVTEAADWEVLDELIVASYRLVAPDVLVRQLDELLGPA